MNAESKYIPISYPQSNFSSHTYTHLHAFFFTSIHKHKHHPNTAQEHPRHLCGHFLLRGRRRGALHLAVARREGMYIVLYVYVYLIGCVVF